MTEQLAAQEVETAPQEELEAAPLEQANSEEVNNEPEVAAEPATNEDPNYIPDAEMSDKVHKRINKLTFEKYELERQKNTEIADLHSEIAKLKVQPAQIPTASKSLSDFGYDEDKYLAYKIDEGVKAAQPVQTAAPVVDVSQQQAAAQWANRQASYAAGNADYAGYAQTMASAVTSKAVESFIVNSEKGPEVHHNLLTNVNELMRIQLLPEWQQGAELAKIEGGLTKAKVKQKQRSKAPEPVKPVTTGKPVNTGSSGGSPFPSSW